MTLSKEAIEIAVGVKALQWVPDADGDETTSNAAVVEYSILGPDRHGLFELIFDNKIIKTDSSKEAVKSFAQSDYETRILSALIFSPVSAPEGWQLVPKVPTVEQECAPDHEDCATPDAARAVYSAMLSAAPSSPGKDGGQEVEAVGEQWRALEDGSPKTSWCPVGYGDEAGWRAIANRHPDKYQVESRPVFARPSQRTVDAGVVCAARRQGTAGGNDPADCNWPFCACDPHADKVIAALQECGWSASQQISDVGAVKIVPIEPTSAMIDAANESEASWKSIWPAMLAAAPVPPSSLAWDGQTVEALIEQYANGAYVARNSEPPISIYRAHFKEFVEKLRPVLATHSASTALVERLTKALEEISDTRCVHDMGFDREVGPLGCSLGDKCVCVGLCTIASRALQEITTKALEGQELQAVAWRWKWKDCGSWIVTEGEPDANERRIIEPLYKSAHVAEPVEYHIVFDGLPSPDGPRFIEVENAAGQSINAGEWRKRADGLCELVIKAGVLING